MIHIRPKERCGGGQIRKIEGSLPSPARPDRRYEPPAGQASSRDRLELSREELRRGVRRSSEPFSITDEVDGRIAILKHKHNFCDEGLCERRLENPYCQLFYPFCDKEFFQHVRPLLDDALAPANGRGHARGAASGEPGRCRSDQHGQAHGLRHRHRRHHNAAEGGGVGLAPTTEDYAELTQAALNTSPG
jgi:hypothetical protein